MKLPVFLTSLGTRQMGSLNTAHSQTGIIGPAVRLLLFHYDIKEKDIKPSGPKGNILKSDVLEFIKTFNLKPSIVKTPIPSTEPLGAVPKIEVKPGQKFVDIPLTNMRHAIAKRLLLSKQSIPHAYAMATINVDKLEAIRSQFKNDGYKVSINDFLIKAVATAIQSVPEVNVRYVNGQIQKLNTIDVSVAVATPSGLITPIIFNANRLGVLKISETVRELTAKARSDKLQPAEFEGGSFSISNLGMFGSVSNFTAIINPPQAAILAVGGTRKELTTNGTSTSLINVTLCYDSRAITDLDAQRFLEHFQMAVEDPDLMVTGTSAFCNLSALL